MKTKILFGITAVVLLGGVSWYVVANDSLSRQVASVSGIPETMNVKIADLPVIDGLPLYLAIEKGFFKEAGLNVELVKFEAPNQIIDAILSGQVDFTSPSGAMGITGIADFKNPGKMKIYIVSGGDEVVPKDSILVRTDSLITSIQDLRDKKLGVLPGIQWRTVAQHILAQSNLTIGEDVTLVELAPGLQAPALASKQVDALLAIEPIPTIVKAKGIGKEVVRAPSGSAIANPFYGGAGAVRLEFAQKNPHTTAKVLEVFARAVEEIRNNPEEAKQYLAGYTPLQDDLIPQAPVLKFKMYNELTKTDIAAAQEFYDIFSTHGVIEGHMDFKQLLYSE